MRFRIHSAGLVIFAAFIIRLAVPAGADSNDPSATPVKIDECTVGEDAARVNPLIGVQPSRTSGVTIGYVDNADVAVTEVHFLVKYRGKTLTFVDRFLVVPHVEVRRQFTKMSEVFVGNSADCSVTSAAFTDGTHWDAAVQSPPSPSPSR